MEVDSYLVIDKSNNSACIVDPSESEPIIEVIEKKKVNLKFILNTHHHYDHVGGNEILKKKLGAKIIAFKDDKNRIPFVDILLEDNEIWKNLNFEFKVLHIPGHTSGHICFYFYKDNIVFSGDTLFSLGCGRIFEGTYEQMYYSLNKFKELPRETKVYCGHEYTLQNSVFCATYDKNNDELNKKILEVKSKRDRNLPTIPSTIGEELACNIFLRAKNLKDFSKLRDLKDNF
jgi:hydroxyacylglutathione hydrolase